MTESSTPEMDKWQDVHARACKAEHDVMMQALGFISVGSPPPAPREIEHAKMLRGMACLQFERAMDELLALPDHGKLAPRLRGGGASGG